MIFSYRLGREGGKKREEKPINLREEKRLKRRGVLIKRSGKEEKGAIPTKDLNRSSYAKKNEPGNNRE